MSASDPLVLVSQAAAVRTLTLNRPQALNSFTTAMHAELLAALEAAAIDEGVRCLVITGAGRGFCAGQDLSDPAVAPDPTPGAAQPDIGALIERCYIPLALRIRSMPVPVIAAVNGVAAGAGANFALGCDLVIAARSTPRRPTAACAASLSPAPVARSAPARTCRTRRWRPTRRPARRNPTSVP